MTTEQKWQRTNFAPPLCFLRNKKSEEEDQDCGGVWCVECDWRGLGGDCGGVAVCDRTKVGSNELNATPVFFKEQKE